MSVTGNNLVTPQKVGSYQVLVPAAQNNTTGPHVVSSVVLIANTENENGGLVKRLYAIAVSPHNADVACQLYRGTPGSMQFADNATLPLYGASLDPTKLFPKADFGVTPDNPMRLKAGEALNVGIYGTNGTLPTQGIMFVAEVEWF